MELTPIELRILGCLVEKEATTPDNYPLSSNALTNACNQKSNREPVTSYTESEVDAAILELRQKSLCRTITGGRANKHRHIAGHAWALSDSELAVLAVMVLRGPQTVGELRTRTERYTAVQDPGDIERVLDQLRARAEPFVVLLPRQPGQKEPRWNHLLGGARDVNAPMDTGARPSGPVRSSSAPAAPPTTMPVTAEAEPGAVSSHAAGAPPIAAAPTAYVAELTEMRQELEHVKQQVAALYELLGEEPPV